MQWRRNEERGVGATHASPLPRAQQPAPATVTVRIPATSANLGPGFDSLGLALSIFTTVQVTASDEARIEHAGQGAGIVPLGPENLIYRSFVRYYQAIGQPAPIVHLRVETEIPLARGLGSSAAAVVAGLYAASAFDAVSADSGDPSQPVLGCNELIELACQAEGHPDNVCPAMLGGCIICVRDDSGRLVHFDVPLPDDLDAVVFVPEQLMSTTDARRILPSQITRADAVYNIGRAALLIGALATGRLEYLRIATQDRLHQPHRQAIFPAMADLFDGALEAGALGVFLSGSGSSILALTRGKAEAVAEGFARTARARDVTGQLRITRPCREGAHVVSGESGVGSRES